MPKRPGTFDEGVKTDQVVWSRTSKRAVALEELQRSIICGNHVRQVQVLTTTWLHGRKPRDLSAQEKLRLVNLAGSLPYSTRFQWFGGSVFCL